MLFIVRLYFKTIKFKVFLLLYFRFKRFFTVMLTDYFTVDNLLLRFLWIYLKYILKGQGLV